MHSSRIETGTLWATRARRYMVLLLQEPSHSLHQSQATCTHHARHYLKVIIQAFLLLMDQHVGRSLVCLM